MATAVVTDSTSDLPPDLAEKHGITIVPLNVHFGTEAYRDNVDMKAEEFYQRLTSGNLLPTTSAPSPGTFIEVYRGLAKDHDHIISLPAAGVGVTELPQQVAEFDAVTLTHHSMK